MITTHRTDQIDRRVAELMASPAQIVDLFDDLQQRGGNRYHALCLAIKNHFAAGTHADAESAVDTACLILRSVAFERAAREYDTSGLPS